MEAKSIIIHKNAIISAEENENIFHTESTQNGLTKVFLGLG